MGGGLGIRFRAWSRSSQLEFAQLPAPSRSEGCEVQVMHCDYLGAFRAGLDGLLRNVCGVETTSRLPDFQATTAVLERASSDRSQSN